MKEDFEKLRKRLIQDVERLESYMKEFHIDQSHNGPVIEELLKQSESCYGAMAAWKTAFRKKFEATPPTLLETPPGRHQRKWNVTMADLVHLNELYREFVVAFSRDSAYSDIASPDFKLPRWIDTENMKMQEFEDDKPGTNHLSVFRKLLQRLPVEWLEICSSWISLGCAGEHDSESLSLCIGFSDKSEVVDISCTKPTASTGDRSLSDTHSGEPSVLRLLTDPPSSWMESDAFSATHKEALSFLQEAASHYRVKNQTVDTQKDLSATTMEGEWEMVS